METAYQAKRRIGHDVEARLAKLVAGETDEVINPRKLPTTIDQEIKTEIEKIEI